MSESDPLGLVGQTIDDLRFDECVDTEGRGLVYRGHLKGREEDVAIKCLSLSRLGAGEKRGVVAARFNEETRILKKLADGTHDIVHILSSGMLASPSTGETVQYQVLEWLNGRTLRVDLAERQERKMPGRSLRETLDMIESAALALAHAHSQGIVHRDVQPANLMLVRSGGGMRLKVLDFGLAKILGKEAPLGAEIITDVSPDYAAPEQRVDPPGEIGPWTDVYSLAMVCLEVMRGSQLPNSEKGGVRASGYGVLLPNDVEELFIRATAGDPHGRPADAKAFWTELRSMSNTKPVANPDALAATALDQDAAAAIERVRAMTAGQSGGGGKKQGTMLMEGAPAKPSSVAPVPPPNERERIQDGPLAGTKPIAIPSPLASSIGHGTKTPIGGKGGTTAMPATTPAPQPAAQPLASPKSRPPAPMQQQQQQQPLNMTLPGQQPKSNAMLISIIAAVIVLVIIVAIAMMMRRR